MILGKDYSIRGDGGADTAIIERVAQYVKTKMAEFQEQSALRDDTKVAVLSALNIAMELFDTKAKYEAELKNVQVCQEKIKSLSNMIGNVKAAV